MARRLVYNLFEYKTENLKNTRYEKEKLIMRLLAATKDSFPVKVTLRATANPVPMCQTIRRTGLTQWQTLPKAATRPEQDRI